MVQRLADERSAVQHEYVAALAGVREARDRHIRLQVHRDRRFRDLERARLQTILSKFPDKASTAVYILGQLMTDELCQVCGQVATDAAAEYTRRITGGQCVMCGSTLGPPPTASAVADLTVAGLQSATEILQQTDRELADATREFEMAWKHQEALAARIGKLDDQLGEATLRQEQLVQALPPESKETQHQRSELAALQKLVDEEKGTLETTWTQFESFVGGLARDLASKSQETMDAFDHYAAEFLLEECHLVWSPQTAEIGQEGRQMAFPAFQLDLSGSDFTGAERRDGPEQVSESQREFIDLAFRMALITVATAGRVGSLVIDAPESSLDAVFVKRAGAVLSRFAVGASANRLVVTSNLVDGELIPSLLQGCRDEQGTEPQVVNLLLIAAETAALRALRQEYDAAWKSLVLSNERELPS